MFRPPGSSSVPRFRPVNTRKRAQVVAIVLAACTAIGAAAWTFGVNSEDDFSRNCEREEYVVPSPDQTQVNVYNGSGLIGLGAQIAQELRDRGFNVAKIENDPLARKIRGTGELRYGDPAEVTNILDTLRSWQPGLVLVNDGRRGTDVDFVMGLKFQSLLTEPVPPPNLPQAACKPESD